MITSSFRKIIQNHKSGGCFIGVLNFPAEKIVPQDEGEISLNLKYNKPIWVESKLIVEIFKKYAPPRTTLWRQVAKPT